MSKIIEKSIYENINLLDDIKTDLESSISDWHLNKLSNP